MHNGRENHRSSRKLAIRELGPFTTQNTGLTYASLSTERLLGLQGPGFVLRTYLPPEAVAALKRCESMRSRLISTHPKSLERRGQWNRSSPHLPPGIPQAKRLNNGQRLF